MLVAALMSGAFVVNVVVVAFVYVHAGTESSTRTPSRNLVRRALQKPWCTHYWGHDGKRKVTR